MFEDLISVPTLLQIKAAIIAICVAAGLPANSWILGEPSERWIEIVSRAIDAFCSKVTAQYVRGWFLDLATDPGDPGDLAADQTPRAGWLSNLGRNWYGTTRGGQTYATGFVTLHNAGATTSAPFKAFDLTFQRASAGSDGGHPSYRNTGDPSIYTGFGGTLTIAAGASVTIPISAEQIGTYANDGGGGISVVVTGSFGTLTASNASPVLGQDREERLAYIERCRGAVDNQSPGGPGAAYKRAANTAAGVDGVTLQRHDGSGPVGITRTYVSKDSSTGIVLCYFADDDGPADAVDVESANANIEGVSLGVITDPIGVDPDGGTYTGAAAVATVITVAGSCRIKTKPGGLSGTALQNAVKTAIVKALAAAFADFEIGGEDQTAGAGFIYTTDLQGIARDAYPGLYDVLVTTPAGSSTAIAEGHVATVSTSVGSWAVTVVT